MGRGAKIDKGEGKGFTLDVLRFCERELIP